ncbi:multicopper oxidase family protein [Nocardia goodfellowii]|uniref:Multicopper oxidase CueO n=1 Tax=Nocardia goodfellowii TaxID=882446 RepID=A0ABS4QFR4_9NOCA|nr:multicopper oxidase domain-containing protein [Nocardia goodfellowii]MBP2190544.1 FtsP/CotA-like multicopper oxidase with cupredoxin domain [Nocardia goodfellowii]
MTFSRRGFLAGLAATPIVLGTGCALGRSDAPVPGPRPLPIPPLADSTVDADGVRRFRLTMAPGAAEILPGKHTPTWGVNGPHLGPTLRARRGEAVAIEVRNDLPEPSTLHWHGMRVPARMDGGPHQTIAPGGTWAPSWTIDQPAASLWYHPHPHGGTEKHVYRGLSGFFLVDDDAADRLDLPKDYGVDDIPLVIQDRRFTADGALDEAAPTDIGLLGDTVITNGIAGAYLRARTSRIRLRLLNGFSGRLYHLGFADNRQFQVIGTDGGLLPKPLSLNRIQLSPGERAEIVVPIRAGDTVMLRALPIENRGDIDVAEAREFGFDDSFDILELRGTTSVADAAAVPDALIPGAAIPTAAAVAHRRFDLQWFQINHARMDMNRIDFTVAAGSTEVWTVRNADNWPHNFHVHDVQFRITDIDGAAPPPVLAGWKDTVYTRPGSTYTLVMRFSEHTDPTYPYMYHCHLLLHEDRGMMGQFLVLGPGQQPVPMPMSHGGHG